MIYSKRRVPSTKQDSSVDECCYVHSIGFYSHTPIELPLVWVFYFGVTGRHSLH